MKNILRVTLDESLGSDAGPSLLLVVRRISELGGPHFGGRIKAVDYIRRWVKSIPCVLVEREDGRAQFADDIDVDSLLSGWSYACSSQVISQLNDGIDPNSITALAIFDPDPANTSIAKWPFSSVEAAVEDVERRAAEKTPFRGTKSLIEAMKGSGPEPDPTFVRASTTEEALDAMSKLMGAGSSAESNHKSEVTYNKEHIEKARTRGNKQTVEDAVSALLLGSMIGSW